MTQTQKRFHGECVAPSDEQPLLLNGVLHESPLDLGEGALVSEGNDRLLRPWDASLPLEGVLFQPDITELRSGRRRVVVARRFRAIRALLAIPTGLETEALEALAGRNITLA